MAKTRAQIQMNFQSAMARAAELDELSLKIKKIWNDARELNDRTAVIWQGSGVKEFSLKTGIISVAASTMFSDIGYFADAIRKDARIIYDAEMRALTIARNNSQ